MTLARYVDGTLLVATANLSKLAAMERAKRILDQTGTRLFGVFLNKFNVSRSYGYNYRYYYHYKNYYGEDGAKRKAGKKGKVA